MQQLSLRVFTAVAGLLAAAAASAQIATPAPGLSRVHEFQDWAVACDNQRHCEAQGYFSQNGQDLPVLLRLRRSAGPGTPVRLSLAFGNIAPSGDAEAPMPHTLRPLVVSTGTLRLSLPAPAQAGEDWVFNPTQTSALLAELHQAEQLEVRQDTLRWRVSLKGANAALLKLDDLQERIGTPGALTRPGSKPETRVPGALPRPVVTAQRLPAQPPEVNETLRARLFKAVRALPGIGEQCRRLSEDAEVAATGEIWHLPDGKVLVSFDCWLAAYNGGAAVWLANAQPPYALQEVGFVSLPVDGQNPHRWSWANQPTSLTLERDPDGVLNAHSAAKGRGIGDCWSTQQWVWTGRHFALTDASTSVCKLFTPGGEPLQLWRADVR